MEENNNVQTTKKTFRPLLAITLIVVSVCLVVMTIVCCMQSSKLQMLGNNVEQLTTNIDNELENLNDTISEQNGQSESVKKVQFDISGLSYIKINELKYDMDCSGYVEYFSNGMAHIYLIIGEAPASQAKNYYIDASKVELFLD